MAIICPTVLAPNKAEFDKQMKRVADLGQRLQIDLTDGQFANRPTLPVEEVWWPAGYKADIHLMFKDPLSAIKQLAIHQPHLIIVHSEADVEFEDVYDFCRSRGLKLGLALLPSTTASAIRSAIDKIDHVLIFSGDLGSFGGHADLSLLSKVEELKKMNPQLEVGWDGGINERNVSELVFGGVDVLNVGGYIQNADDPLRAYNRLFRIAEETGTT